MTDVISPIIPEEILRKNGAQKIPFSARERIFTEGDAPVFYYQIAQGEAQMIHYSTEGRTFVQGIFKAGESFGEPAIFGNFPYPSSGEMLSAGSIWRLKRTAFLELLSSCPALHFKFSEVLSKRLLYKSVMQRESTGDVVHRIAELFKYMAEAQQAERPFLISLTRQEVADRLGLRVETVIRAIKKMEKEGIVSLINKKIWLK
ncbi:Crp/Fnr family transcriptional regulator [Persicobacter psychrovividus]|uniref:Crp/Fnr family transcriptional regulator n=1 Tax=Persicobacter psychrovividus TaxID=387638 RepID=A0ABM7VA19_9BACT|nr:hypothetical protein PEPS_00500 [Persicobacter psychrovividus]